LKQEKYFADVCFEGLKV
jgi:hypothetical protein